MKAETKQSGQMVMSTYRNQVLYAGQLNHCWTMKIFFIGLNDVGTEFINHLN